MISITVNATSVQTLLDRAKAAAVNPEPVMQAMGMTLKSITEGTFNSVGAGYRPRPWPPKADGKPSILQKTTTLAKSFRLTVGPTWATVSTDRPYAAIHQFGGRTGPHKITPRRKKALAFTSAKFGNVVVRGVNHPGSNIPARPFFPITPEGRFTDAAGGLIVRAGERALARLLGTQLA